jgi:hypothetical protein
LEDERYAQRFLMVGFGISNAEPSSSSIREQSVTEHLVKTFGHARFQVSMVMHINCWEFPSTF